MATTPPPSFLCSISICSKDWDSRELWPAALWLCSPGSLQQGLQTTTTRSVASLLRTWPHSDTIPCG